MTPHRLAERGLETVVLPLPPRSTSVIAAEPDGVFFSNGPGDPATADHEVAVLRGVLDRGLPVLRDLLRPSAVRPRARLRHLQARYGHRGINQPVKDLTTGKVEVTAHNHGFAVEMPRGRALRRRTVTATVSHVCLNDDVVEGPG